MKTDTYYKNTANVYELKAMNEHIEKEKNRINLKVWYILILSGIAFWTTLLLILFK